MKQQNKIWDKNNQRRQEKAKRRRTACYVEKGERRKRLTREREKGRRWAIMEINVSAVSRNPIPPRRPPATAILRQCRGPPSLVSHVTILSYFAGVASGFSKGNIRLRPWLIHRVLSNSSKCTEYVEQGERIMPYMYMIVCTKWVSNRNAVCKRLLTCGDLPKWVKICPIYFANMSWFIREERATIKTLARWHQTLPIPDAGAASFEEHQVCWCGVLCLEWRASSEHQPLSCLRSLSGDSLVYTGVGSKGWQVHFMLINLGSALLTHNGVLRWRGVERGGGSGPIKLSRLRRRVLSNQRERTMTTV